MNPFWQTAISQVKTDEILVRGYPIEQLIDQSAIGDVMYLLFTGELPRGNEGRLVEAILVACCEHSLASPSVDAVRFVASSGVPLQASVAAGVTAIGDVHGGAIEPCAYLLTDAVKRGLTAEQVFDDLRAKGERLPGYGHRVHKHDPRSPALLAKAEQLGLAGPHTKLARELEQVAAKRLGRPLNLNVDGAVAALIVDIGIAATLGKALFITSRTPGYAAHAHEQMTKERPFKAAEPDEIHYTGPARRDLPSAAPDANQEAMP